MIEFVRRSSSIFGIQNDSEFFFVIVEVGGHFVAQLSAGLLRQLSAGLLRQAAHHFICKFLAVSE